LTGRGRELLAQIEPLYTKEVKRIMAVLKINEQKTIIEMLERIRGNVSGIDENKTQDISLLRV
jgi:DNA-binding MarR family transcriptional regulator